MEIQFEAKFPKGNTRQSIKWREEIKFFEDNTARWIRKKYEQIEDEMDSEKAAVVVHLNSDCLTIKYIEIINSSSELKMRFDAITESHFIGD